MSTTEPDRLVVRESPRVIYSRNPLAEVICQVRFPPLLELEQSPPARFQTDFAKETYPLLEVVRESGTGLRINIASKEPAQPFPLQNPPLYHFSDVESNWRLTVCSSFFALSTTKYERWEDFRDRFASSFRAFLAVYSVPIVLRLGLRYSDVIDRKKLGLGNVPWSDLIAPHVSNAFGLGALFEGGRVPDSAVESTFSQSRIRLKTCNLLLQSGLSEAPEGENFTIDADYYVDTPRRADLGYVLDTLESLHVSAGALFRGCISPALRDALKPA